MMQLSSDGKRLVVQFNSREGFTAKEIERHAYAGALIEKVVNTKEFVERVKKRTLLRTNGLSKEQLIALIFSGAEILRPETDGAIDVDAVMYHSNGKVVGYTNPGTIKTWVNRKFFSQYSYAEIACNLFHEWLHKLGFDHKSATDWDSVPYSLGYLIEEMINELLAGKVFTPLDGIVIDPTPIQLPPPAKKVWVCYRKWIFFKKCGWEYESQGQCCGRPPKNYYRRIG